MVECEKVAFRHVRATGRPLRDSLNKDVLRAIPKRASTQLGQCLSPVHDREKVIASELPHFAGETRPPVCEEKLCLAVTAGIK